MSNVLLFGALVTLFFKYALFQKSLQILFEDLLRTSSNCYSCSKRSELQI